MNWKYGRFVLVAMTLSVKAVWKGEIKTTPRAEAEAYKSLNAAWVVMVFGSSRGGGLAMLGSSDKAYERAGTALADSVSTKTFELYLEGTSQFSGVVTLEGGLLTVADDSLPITEDMIPSEGRVAWFDPNAEGVLAMSTHQQRPDSVRVVHGRDNDGVVTTTGNYYRSFRLRCDQWFRGGRPGRIYDQQLLEWTLSGNLKYDILTANRLTVRLVLYRHGHEKRSDMNISKREFLKRLGIGGAALAGAPLMADEYVKTKNGLPPGSVGDPDNVWFGKNIFPLGHTIEDGPSCAMKDGKVFCPAREIPIFHKTDVVVVGGGPAGFAAAIAAARTGAKVALVERHGSLGGLFTNGMVLLMLCTSQRLAGGKWRFVTRGLTEEFADRSRALGSYVCTARPKDLTKTHWQPTVDPEGAKYLMDTMVAEEKIDMFFHCWGVDVIQSGNQVQGIVFESKQGKQAILAKQVVDCTGDGDVLYAAGGDYRQITHGIGHVVRLANMDRITAKAPPRDMNGKVKAPVLNKWPTRSNEANPSTWWGNFGTGPKGNGLDVRDLTAAEIDFRKKWWEHVAAMRQEPGWEQVFIANTCSQIGPRASRLIETELVIDRAMLRGAFKPEDSIGMFGHDGKHAAFQVPYRALLPKKVDNVLCAGRMLGAPDTCDTFRLICPCIVTGQAAGTAAAMAALKGCTPRALSVPALQAQLVKDKVVLA